MCNNEKVTVAVDQNGVKNQVILFLLWTDFRGEIVVDEAQLTISLILKASAKYQTTFCQYSKNNHYEKNYILSILIAQTAFVRHNRRQLLKESKIHA
ncbi:hypothetical protein CS542_03290 [Pedobacter sp. IW39]|nr:hypothetical protein CS542_03290 [Pedobacter sp. IW39]